MGATERGSSRTYEHLMPEAECGKFKPQKEMECQPLLTIRRCRLWSRWLITIWLAITLMGEASAPTEKLAMFVAITTLVIGVTRAMVAGYSFRWEAAEGLLSVATLALVALSAVFTVVRVAVTIEFLSLLVALGFSASSLYCISRYMSPPEEDMLTSDESLTRIFEPIRVRSITRRGRTGLWLLAGVIAGAWAGVMVPSGTGSKYLAMLLGALACLWLYKGVLPASRVLRLAGCDKLLALAEQRGAGKHLSYIFFLIRRNGHWPSASFYLLTSLFVGLSPFYWLVNSFDRWEVFRFAKEATFVTVGTGMLVVAFILYKKAISQLRTGIARSDEAMSLMRAGGYVLYLRSFSDDEFAFESVPGGWKQLLQALQQIGLLFLQRAPSLELTPTRFEDIIVRTLWSYRPVLCVTAPFDELESSSNDIPLARTVALRLDLQENTWRTDVSTLASRADLIVMVMATTSGLRWEFGALSAIASIRKRMVLLVPPENEVGMRVRWSVFLDDQGEHSDVVIENYMLRAIAVKLGATSDSDVLFTAEERSVAAYELALRLSPLPTSSVG